MENSVTVSIKNEIPYEVLIRNSFSEINEQLLGLYSKDCKLCIIADENVYNIYGDELKNELSKTFNNVFSISLTLGENNKSLETVSKCYSYLLENKFNRKDVILALGGGICGDISGFVAASYMRGIDFVQIPTTLLSMVDSSSGGKTGVNFEHYKNMIGAFKMPRLVYINTATLNTLSDKEYASGMAEVLKSALIRDGIFYEWLINNFPMINDKDSEYLTELLVKCINIKKYYVEKDPYEKNERAILNFGHTVGHALEKYTDFKYSHGECVALGMVVASFISWKKNYLSMEDYYEIRDMFVPFNLPISMETLDIDKIVEYTKSDKKNTTGALKFILLKKIGKGIISENVTEAELKEAVKEIDFGKKLQG